MATRQTFGRITLLRVHEVGTGYGPPNDFLDVEVVVQIDNEPRKAFGFVLRDDKIRLLHEQMLGLLREAYARDVGVTLVHLLAGTNNHILKEVVVNRPQEGGGYGTASRTGLSNIAPSPRSERGLGAGVGSP